MKGRPCGSGGKPGQAPSSSLSAPSTWPTWLLGQVLGRLSQLLLGSSANTNSHGAYAGAVPTNGLAGNSYLRPPPCNHHRALSRISSKVISSTSRLSMSDNRTPARPPTITSVRDRSIALKEGSALAARLPYISPIAGLLLQALTMRDVLKQCKEECKLVMHKLARVASIIVNVGKKCEKHNLKEEDLPPSLLAILDFLQRELDEIERVLKECSKKKGIKGLFLRKDLLTKIKQCDGELSNVLQAFQAELALDTRFALIAERREVTADSSLVEAIWTVPQGPNGAQKLFNIMDGKEAIVCHDNFESPWDQFIKRSTKGQRDLFFFEVGSPLNSDSDPTATKPNKLPLSNTNVYYVMY
ncbi:hypothetical protein H4582DRAFT_121826 [Lactarius indigo]|nr:hypothetical protein H4582DRAFT_121826 [Lactarius indigo]